jgi:hypothetical protein
MHPRSNIKAGGHTFLRSNRSKKLTASAGSNRALESKWVSLTVWLYEYSKPGLIPTVKEEFRRIYEPRRSD